jgi:hypothetical protein
MGGLGDEGAGGVAAGAGTAGEGSGWRGPPHALLAMSSVNPNIRATSLTGGASHLMTSCDTAPGRPTYP